MLIEKGNFIEFKKMVLREKRLIHEKDEKENTLLSLAVDKNQYNIVKFLIEHGARVDLFTRYGFPITPYIENNSPISALLIQNDAPVSGSHEIHYASKKGNLKRVKEVLKHGLLKSDITLDGQDNFGRTPLMYAVMHGKSKVAKYLLAQGSKRYTDNRQKNIIDYAKKNGKDTALSLYLKSKIGISKENLIKLSNQFQSIIKKEYDYAKKNNKNLLILLGEFHGDFRIEQLKKEFLLVLKQIGVKNLYVELPGDNDDGKLEEEIYGAEIGMHVSRIDNHLYRTQASVQERNIVITEEIHKKSQPAVFVTGVNHLEGFLQKPSAMINPKKFHVLPFDLTPMASAKYAPRPYFVNNKKNTIQVTNEGISSPKSVIRKWNNQKRTEDYIDPKLIFLNRASKGMYVALTISSVLSISLCSFLALQSFAAVAFTIAITTLFGMFTHVLYEVTIKQKLKTEGLLSYRREFNSIEWQMHEKYSVFTNDQLNAFMDGTKESYSHFFGSFFSLRDWRHLKDYYAGYNAKETNEDKLIGEINDKIGKRKVKL